MLSVPNSCLGDPLECQVVIAALRILAKIMEAHPPEALSIADLAPEPELDSGLSPKETLGEVREKGG